MADIFNGEYGGIADSKYSGVKGSFYRSVGVDGHSTPGLLKVHQKLSKHSSTTIDELCKVAIPVSDGSKLWFSSESGKIWREVSGTYTLVHTTALADEPFNSPVQFAVLNGTNQKFTITNAAQTGLNFTASGTVRVLLVGGGGGGGRDYGGGGGAGEFEHVTSHTLESDTISYSVTVGAGGAGSTVNTDKGVSGGNSTFDTLTANGGGGGGSTNNVNGANGGSGGGGANASGTGGTSTASGGLGNAGGTANTQAGAGGGGSASAGSNASGTTGGAGGAGTSNDISGSSVTYAAGGKGGNNTGGTGADGTNPGDGGGGGEGSGASGGAGIDGIVIIRYATDGSDGINSASTGGTKTTSGSDTIHTFTSDGTFSVIFTEAKFSIVAQRYNLALPTDGNYMSIAEKWNETGDQRSWAFRLYNDSGTYKLVISLSVSGAATQVERSQAIDVPLGEWYSCGVTFSKSADEVKFYFNGSQVGSTVTTLMGNNRIFPSTAGVGVGGQADNASYLWNGYVSDTRIWDDRVLSAAEMTSYHSDPSAFAETTDLVADWRFDGDATDETANNNDLTNNNTITFTAFGGTQPGVKCLGGEEYDGYVYWATEDREWRIALANIDSDWSDTFLTAFGLFENTDDTYHPHVKQNNELYIGDKYVIAKVSVSGTSHVWTDETDFDILQPERIISLGKIDIDVLVGTLNVNVGRVLRWDTVSTSWTGQDDIYEAGVLAFMYDDNYVYALVGNFGKWFFYNGEKLEPYFQIPGEWSPSKKAVVHPNAVGFLLGKPIFGLSNSTGNPALQGVYTFGSHSKNYPKVLDLSFPISSDEVSGMTIGAIIVDGADLYVSWKGASAQGVDKLDYSNKYASAYLESRMLFGEERENLKTLGELKALYNSLPSGTGVTFSYNKNNAGYVAMTDVDDDKLNALYTELSVGEIGSLQVKMAFDVSSNNAPEIEKIVANQQE